MALALFDLDETLLRGDSASLWLEYLVEQGLAPADMLAREQAMMNLYHQGKMDMHAYMAFTLAPLAGKARAWVDGHCQHFCEQWLLPRLYREGLERIAWHQRRGDTLVLISASGEHIVAPVARALGMDHCIAIELDMVDGRLTGETRGVLSFRQGKVARLRECFGEASVGSFAYSDSINDLPLLEWAEFPHATNPAKALRELAQARHWPVLEWDKPRLE